ncbi:uncharacterized protein LOC106665117 [Cimex lectularius]|uniref:Uncharacterized protein n=1 Tax=Cimex lectularius TaxID=79782 RepID=A0A8I6RKG7_CIMLE|nr:uncharacterized protein LOC106665117 [Cimex lectularius]
MSEGSFEVTGRTTTESLYNPPKPFGDFSDEDRNAFMKNPLYKTHREFGDFTAFYITITICTIFGFGVFLLNIFFCWCSKHKDYWRDSNTGNRWIFPIWTKSPYRQPPLDLTELEETVKAIEPTQVYDTSEAEHHTGYGQEEYLELHKRESDL